MSTNGNGNGRHWDDEYLVQCYDLAKQGQSDQEIAENIGVRLHVLRRWMRQQPHLSALMERARETIPEEPDSDESQSHDLSQVVLDLSHLKTSQRKFLACYAQTGNVSHAARLAGLARENHYRWMEDEDYAETFRYADQHAVDRLEGEAWRRGGTEGLKRYKFTQSGRRQMIRCEENHPEAERREDEDGEVWYERHYYEHEYSDTLLIFLLKARRPERFREQRTPIEVNSQTNVGVDLNALVKLSERDNVIDVDVVKGEAQKLIEAHNGDQDG